MHVLVIPDTHAHPDHDNRRFTLLGEYVAAAQPDVVVMLGDWWDMPSICKWSKKWDLEGRRYKADIDVGIDAMRKFMAPIRARKKKLPRFVFLMGNHEARVNLLVADRPEFEGIISEADFKLERFGWEVVPFNEVIEIGGFHFTHHFPSGIMGKATGGKHVGNSLIMGQQVSCIQGHNHIFDHKVVNRRDGSPVHGFTAGCFIHPKAKEGWNKAVRHMYHLGVLHLYNAKDGDASYSWARMADMEREIGIKAHA